MKTVRTRFAPSPTGYLHVGGIRTALFAWLIARQTSDGKFILRIEDTDKAREVEGSDEHIMKSLRILGLEYDEGPDVGGPYGPYKQSERLDLYKEWAETLVAKGRAYADPYTPEQLNEFREQAKLQKKPFLFRNHRPENPPKWDGSQPLRFKSDPKDYTWNDAVMGDISTKAEAIDDFILMKADGYPTYNFSHIVDDVLMEITHVIRGQEFISSTPNYLNLYEALDVKQPIIASTPPVLGPNGQKKLSKRDGAKDVLEYINEGYLVEALINFMASLGWSDGTTQEIFSVQELIEKFKLSNVQRSGSNFDERRLDWMDGAHIRELSIDDLYAKSLDFWPESSKDSSDEYKKKVLSIIQERLKYLSEIPALTSFFFEDIKVNPDLIKEDKKLGDIAPDQLKEWLTKSKDTLSDSDFSLDDISRRLNELLTQTNQKPAVLFSLIRIATTQSKSSPGLFETIEVLGRDKTLNRLDQQIAALG